jgi:CRP-like cAMP-binding protein
MKDQESLKPLTSFLSNYIKVEQDVIDFLEGTAEYRRFDKKDIIQQQGQSQKYLGFILQGAVRFYYTDEEGSEDTFEFIFEHLPLGQYKTLLSQENVPASVQAMEVTELLLISKDNFQQFMNRFPEYYPVIASVMSEAIFNAIPRNKLIKISSSKERYHEFCKLFLGTHHRIPLTYIASYLNMAIGTLSKVRAGKL